MTTAASQSGNNPYWTIDSEEEALENDFYFK
jgi:hypothetical protein